MKLTIPAALIALLATSAATAEPFSGTHAYRPDNDIWHPVPGAGWWTSTMVGDYVPTSGPIPAGRIECRGTGDWHGSVREADGICVFGEGQDVWMLRYRMTRNDMAAQRAEAFRRIGEWTVVGGTGRYSGMTDERFCWADWAEGAPVAPDGRRRTHWGGEVTIPTR